MPIFSYKAKDRAGSTVTGTVDADSESHAAGLVREMGHLPMDIRMSAGAPAVVGSAGSPVARYLIHPIWTGVNIRHLLFFYRQMATLLAAGMTISEALRSVQNRTGGRLGRIIGEMYQATIQGGRLSDVMSCHPRVFSRLQLSLVRVGEAGGMLDQMVERIASYLEHEMSIRRQVIKALFYPIMIFAFIVLKPIILGFILGGSQVGLLLLLGALKGTVLPLVIIILLLKLIFQFEPMRLIWDTAKIQPPVIGTCARKIAMSRFSRALSTLYGAGMSMPEAISVSGDACANVAIARALRQAIPAIQSGQGVTESLTRTRSVMPMVMDMLAVGEKTGSMDATLPKVADYMDEEVDVTIHKMSILLFVLMIVAAGVVVAIQLLGAYSGYFNSIEKAGSG